MPSLDKLDFRSCSGLLNNWGRTKFKSISTVKKLSLSATNEISGHVFEHFWKLETITIDVCDCNAAWQIDNFAKIFDLHRLIGYESVGRLITKKLPKLESLGLGFQLKDNAEYMTELPQLRLLHINCDGRSISSLLRTLNNGIIEMLIIEHAKFDSEDENATPLIFNKLQRLAIYSTENMPNILITMTKSQMPVINLVRTHDLKCTQSHLNEILKFIDSKTTLRLIQLNFDNPVALVEFFRQLINILKKPCTPRRLFLNLQIRPFQHGAEMVGKIIFYVYA